MTEPTPPDELETQLVRAQLFTHTGLSQLSTRVLEIETFLYGLIDLLIANGATTDDTVTAAAIRVRNEIATDSRLALPIVALRADPAQPPAPRTVNCAERLPICHAVCCRLDFALDRAEVEGGKVKWDLGRPYFIRRTAEGMCCHNDAPTGGCRVYADRPGVCRTYSCEGDPRIWRDFEGMELNDEWLDEHVYERPAPHLVEAQMDPRVRRPDAADATIESD
jgi:Fe-S-cluster containining protein